MPGLVPRLSGCGTSVVGREPDPTHSRHRRAWPALCQASTSTGKACAAAHRFGRGFLTAATTGRDAPPRPAGCCARAASGGAALRHGAPLQGGEGQKDRRAGSGS